ncbi:hypothetical protein E3Q18_03724 [Wallemia mellicola]|nr:hypothetical protein E3Q18_03724 [Wallemia mellicola]
MSQNINTSKRKQMSFSNALEEPRSLFDKDKEISFDVEQDFTQGLEHELELALEQELDREPYTPENVNLAPVSPPQPPKRVRKTRKPLKNPKAEVPRPRNAWIIYRTNKSKELRRRRGDGIGMRALSAAISELWAKETDDVKTHFKQLAEKEKEMHKILWPDYKFSPRKNYPVKQGDTRKKKQTRKENKPHGRLRGRPRKAPPQSTNSVNSESTSTATVSAELPNVELLTYNDANYLEFPDIPDMTLPQTTLNPVYYSDITSISSSKNTFNVFDSQYGQFSSPTPDYTVNLPTLQYLQPHFSYALDTFFADIEESFNKASPYDFFNISQDLFNC